MAHYRYTVIVTYNGSLDKKISDLSVCIQLVLKSKCAFKKKLNKMAPK